LNWRVPTVVNKLENVMVVVLDTPKMAVSVGTAAGVQLVPVLKSPDPGLRSQVAFCAGAANGPRSAAISPTNTARRSICALPLHDR
jgi:hypothetical protein